VRAAIGANLPRFASTLSVGCPQPFPVELLAVEPFAVELFSVEPSAELLVDLRADDLVCDLGADPDLG
jgi:hypothetical protein